MARTLRVATSGLEPYGAFAVGCASLSVSTSLAGHLLSGPVSRIGHSALTGGWVLTPAEIVRALTATTVVPIGEELILRGVLMKALVSRLRPRAAVLTSAGVFASYHIFPTQMAVALTLGFVNGLAYSRTRSVVPCIAGHVAWNTVATVLGFTAPHSAAFVVAIATPALAVSALSFWRWSHVPASQVPDQAP